MLTVLRPFLAACGAVLLLCGAVFGQPAPGSVMQDVINTYQQDSQDVSRFYNTTWSPTRLDRIDALCDQQQRGLAALDFDSLDQQGKVDYLLLRNALRNKRAYNDLARRRLAEMEPLLPFRQAICDLEETRWRMEPSRPQEASLTIAAMPDQIKKLRDRIEKGRKTDGQAQDAGPDAPLAVSPVVAQRASSAVSSLRSNLRWWYEYYEQFEPGFSWWVSKPFEQADRALHDYAEYLRKEVAGLKGEDSDPLVGDPIGRETLVEDLRNEMIAYSPEELIRIGEREFAWCEAELRKAAGEMGLGEDWKAALERVKNSYVEPGEQTHYCTQIVREQIEFLKTNDLLTLPDLVTELWRLEMITPDRQKFWPFQYYGGLHIGVGYASDEQSVEERLQVMRGNNKHFTRIVVPHELIPGHHLQGFMSERHRPYRRQFSTPFFLEGWCLYWEMKLWDLNWGKSPEDRIGMLFWRMHRAARIIISLKFHLGEMQPQEMIDFLVEKVGHEKSNATGEVRRYIGGDYSPLYQCGYLIGGLQVRALHREMVTDGPMKEREFNDRMLTFGTVPVELIRDELLGLPLTRETEATWKFAD
ncbi:MAG: hypothetical protein GIKADHBN_02530 [Phycisphaerales bacterium]|nr:hypothetical protein [Phycisphaerales bacterium]